MRIDLKTIKNPDHRQELIDAALAITGDMIEICGMKYKSLKHKYQHSKVSDEYLYKEINKKPVDNRKIKGLGDVVALFAQPVAKVIDTISMGKTNLQSCGGCKRRQASLNEQVPF